MYKICLDDRSFIIADDEYKLSLFIFGIKTVVTVENYLTNRKKYKYHYLIDNINSKKIKRKFTIEEIESTTFKVGSRIKYARDIRVDDLVMGTDGLPRRVKELHSGEEEMFEITVNGTSYTVNGGHILALVDRETGEHHEIPVNIFMHMDEESRACYAMEKIDQLNQKHNNI